ncbi:rap guanine nucleotide exchange factor 5b isoform X1 [Tachysurus fulvidraco]|uniref:rap guanine nucleotide exchange factor 5b isoform X1 n=1 Tax=Tachysurus fulvidraco TaxID=1234273 RepID=UPI000F501EE2|nr:rap guanine nucleotide exchange factor 5b isoform X1 [Tachysurus fulvidraco]
MKTLPPEAPGLQVNMAMLEESPLPGKSDLLYLRWSLVVKEQQARLSPSKEDAPVINKHTPLCRKKSSQVIASEEQPPETISCLISDTRHKVCVQNVSCAGRALRNAFLSNGQENWKAHVKLARIIKRSFIGRELVQWLTEHCVFVGNRNAAARVWNGLLELGILLSVERLAVFEDSETLYQFSFEECEAQSCAFRNQIQWQNGVNVLLGVSSQTPLHVAAPKPSEGEHKKHSLACSSVDVVQMRALERLTSKVQNELTATLARKGRCKSMIEDIVPENALDLPPSTLPSSGQKQGSRTGVCNREDMSRMEMVQRLAKDGCHLLHSPLKPTERPAEPLGDAAVRVCMRERSREMLLLQRTTSEQAPSSSSSSPSSLARRYASVPASPERVLEHLLSHLTLDEDSGSPQARETESLLDDFLLTYPVFMSTSDLCQALLGHYCLKQSRTKNEGKESLLRKRKVLHLLSQWIALGHDTLQDGEHTKVFLKMLYRCVLDDLCEFPTLEKEVKELQKLFRMQRRHTVEEYSPQRKNKALFHQLSLKETWQPTRTAPRQNKEVLCHVYVNMDSYVSVRTHSEVTVQELLTAVAERLECAEDDMVLVAVTYSRGKELLQPQQCVYSDSLGAVSRLCVCRRDLTEITSLVTDNGQMQQPTVRMLTMNTWDIALALTNCDWSLFRNLQEQELVYFTLSRDSCSGHTAALELLLQRCNEVQQWVMTEVLLCPMLCKRVQLFKKFIKTAAHCKAQRNLNSFFAIIMGLNTPAVSRLTQTWEKVPGKFKKLFSELESLTDPSFNHKAYRDAFKKMKSPKIPFLPLLLKDITFIHEGNKTFLDNLVNFEKLHMMADMVRVIRHCQTDHMGNMLSQKESPDVKAYINYLHIIDNQQTLFELSHRLETKV